MAIKIVESGPDLYLTQSEYNRLLAEYQQAFMFYAGTPPDFEDWIRSRPQVWFASGSGPSQTP